MIETRSDRKRRQPPDTSTMRTLYPCFLLNEADVLARLQAAAAKPSKAQATAFKAIVNPPGLRSGGFRGANSCSDTPTLDARETLTRSNAMSRTIITNGPCIMCRNSRVRATGSYAPTAGTVWPTTTNAGWLGFGHGGAWAVGRKRRTAGTSIATGAAVGSRFQANRR